MTIDLTQFCAAVNSDTRPYFHAPFSMGDFSYATNGHILVRVARRDDVRESSEQLNADKPLEGAKSAQFYAPNVKLPKIEQPIKGECADCDGRGREHSCPDCECICSLCEGTGTEIPEIKTSTEIGGVVFNLRYIRKMLALPNVVIASPSKDAPFLFRFDGGVGAVMPMCGKHVNHIEIETTSEEVA